MTEVSDAIQILLSQMHKSTHGYLNFSSYDDPRYPHDTVALSHGGQQVTLAILKLGPSIEVGQELSVIFSMPPEIAPEVYGLVSRADGQSGYVMEILDRESWHPTALLQAREALRTKMWHRGHVRGELTWEIDFEKRFGFYAPTWIVNERWASIHGDPTVANIMWRRGEVVLIDPKPCGRGIPAKQSVDDGKMMQSLAGWETLLSGRHQTDQIWPFLAGEHVATDDELLRALWWCAVHMHRITQREEFQSEIYTWASSRMVSIIEFFKERGIVWAA